MGELKWPVRGLEHIPLKPGSVVVLAAPPVTGKTTFALDLALHWASSGHRVVLAPTETDLDYRLMLRERSSDITAAGRNLLALLSTRLNVDAISRVALEAGADAIIIDELQFLRCGKSHFTIAEIANRLGCVVVATCTRNPMIDTIMDATGPARYENMPSVGKAVL